MDAAKVARVVLSASVFLQLCSVIVVAYEIPDVTIEVFTPQGFRGYIPDSPGITFLAFQGNINRAIEKNDVGDISVEVQHATNGRWVFEDPNLKLKVGDIINYVVFVSVNSAGFIRDKLRYTVTALQTQTTLPTVTVTAARAPPVSAPAPPPPPCPASVTRVRGAGNACAGQTIFEDNFDSFQEDKWKIEHYIPLYHPDFPFVSYQRLASAPTVSVVDGNLRIAPKLQQHEPGFNNDSINSGTLDLFSGCTGVSRECTAESLGAHILPPVVSGRVASKGFAFTYGTVHIRAKLPQGDWLYPEILLEPFLKKYGESNYASGVLKIAVARGNRDLRAGISEFGNNILYGGPVMDVKCSYDLIDTKKLTNGKMWGDDFHLYSLHWTPDRITLLVDSEEWLILEPASSLKDRFTSSCNLPVNLLAKGGKMAPFDDDFYITLGVAAGGVNEFRDDLYSNRQAKPWRNTASKATLQFWNAMNSWYPTWRNAELLVDYVKVIAL